MRMALISRGFEEQTLPVVLRGDRLERDTVSSYRLKNMVHLQQLVIWHSGHLRFYRF